MGDTGDTKWHRALLKKLRSAVAVKSRVDAGDAGSLQKSQAGKGTKRAIDDALASLKLAGLGRDAPLVAAAFEQGLKEGGVAMELAKKRGPDGGADGTTPSKKRLKREARAEAWTTSGGGGGGDEKSGFGAANRIDKTIPDPANATTIRNPLVSGHVFAACKRAVFVLHALTKENEHASTTQNDKSWRVRFHEAVETLCEKNSSEKKPSLVVAADAQLAGIGLWALAKTSRRAFDITAKDTTKDTKDTTTTTTTTSILSTSLKARALVTNLSAALSRRFISVCDSSDARGAATAAWAVASLATAQPACMDRAVAVTLCGRAMRRLDRLSSGERKKESAVNPQDAANALWACAKLRVVVDVTCAKALVGVVANGTDDPSKIDKKQQPTNPREMSAVLWSLATLHGDGLCPDAPSLGVALAKKCGDKCGAQNFSPRVLGDAAWACGKLFGALVDGSAVTHKEPFKSAVTQFARAAAASIQQGTSSFPPRNAANVLWACASVRVDAEVAEPLAMSFFATATAAGRADAERKRRGLAKQSAAAGGKGDFGKGKKGHKETNVTKTESKVQESLKTNDSSDSSDFDFAEDASDSVSFESASAKPSPSDIAVAVEAVSVLQLTSVPLDKIRSAISSALTAPKDGTPEINWRAAGRLEHGAFGALRVGMARSVVEVGAGGVTKQDAEVLKRLLRRGAAAAAEADLQRLTLEEGSGNLVTDLLVKEFGTAVVDDLSTEKKKTILCVDDTHRLLSLPLREQCGFKVTNWNRFCRRERSGSVWPASTKELFTCATVRYPSTRNAAAMVMTATASRLAPNASIYLYGARVEGIHSACFVTGGAGDRKGNEQGDTFHPAVPRDLFTDPEIVSTSRCGGFAVARCLRKETLAEETSDGKAQDVSRKKNPGSSMEAFRKTATLVLPASDSSPNGGETTTVTDWHTYPGLFAGGGLDVMTNVLLKAMPGKFGLDRNHENAPFTVLDYCAGSGVLAAALQSRIPQNSVLTLCDADSVALHCARENFVVNAHHTQRTVVVPSDCFGGLSPTETFDLIVSNPPVHLGLQSEFTVLRQLLCECVNRLNNGGTCWLVAQRYVPVAAMAHEENVDVACAFADDKFAAWVLRKGSSDSEEKSDTKEGTTSKKDKKDKKEQKEKKEKKK